MKILEIFHEYITKLPNSSIPNRKTGKFYLATTSSATWRIWLPVSWVLCPLVVVGIAELNTRRR